MSKLNRKDIINLARCYANALYAYGLNFNKLDAIQANLESFYALFNESSELHEVLLNPSLSKNIIINIVTDLAQKLNYEESFKNTLTLLAMNRRMFIIDLILSEYTKLVNHHKNIEIVDVYVASAISVDEQNIIKNILNKKLYKNITLRISKKKELLGGMQIKYGSTVIDMSLLNQLEKISSNCNALLSGLI